LNEIVFASCKKEDAVKDVESTINKLNYFNETFNTFYADGVISKESQKEDEKSEFEKLKSIATEYYDLMNKINNTCKDDKEYEANYKNIIKE